MRVKVYRLTNHDTKEVYHGISNNPEERYNKHHCIQKTKAISHWDCDNHKIIKRDISEHNSQENASRKAHDLERTYKHRLGYKNIRTSGK